MEKEVTLVLVTGRNYRENSFVKQCKTLQQILDALKEAKEIGLDHVHLNFCYTDKNAINESLGEVIVPFENNVCIYDTL